MRNIEEEEFDNIEDHYDYRQTYLKALLNSVSRESIKEVWRIFPYMVSKSYQHIIILEDGTHLCTCLLLVSHGVVCRHYFKLMVENSDAMFHVLLMPTRWLRDDTWGQIDHIFKEPFIGTSSKHLKQLQYIDTAQGTNLIPTHYNNIQEVQVRNHVQKKNNYGRLMGHFKKALDFSLEDGDQDNLDNIILTYISQKQAKRKANAQSETRNILEEYRNLGDKIKLSDGRVYDVDCVKDPIKHNCKGRPANKRLKGFGEENNTSKVQKENMQNKGENLANTNGRKCGLCHKIGHYAPKCPNRDN